MEEPVGLLMLTSLVLVASVGATSDRSHCSGPVARTSLLSPARHDNVGLSNHVLKSFARRSLMKCVTACIKYDECLSVNYQESTNICELNSGGKDNYPQEITAKNGWVFYDVAGDYVFRSTSKVAAFVEVDLLADCSVTSDKPTAITTPPEPTSAQLTTIVPTQTEALPVDCWDVHIRLPTSASGEYTVYPTMRNGPLQVYCDMNTGGGGWTVIQRRLDNSEDFYQDWASYKMGFGDRHRNFWVGNDGLHELTSRRAYLLVISMDSYMRPGTYAAYGPFAVGSEATKYRLTVGNFYGSYIAGDSLTYHNGQAFSTFDQENDIDTLRHCAVTCRGGWWYKDCIMSNLNGPYSTTAAVDTGLGIIWGSWETVSRSLKFVEMKIRPFSVTGHILAQDCWDHFVQGATSGTYDIHVTGMAVPLRVYCDMDDAGGGWTRRGNGSVDFYRDWAQYRAGFGNVRGEFWMGNDNIHLLTNQQTYQLLIKLQSWDPATKYASYGTFSIADEANLYRLSIGGFSERRFGLGDSLWDHNGNAWSTRDRDNDNDARQCAQEVLGAWWYNSCGFSNLNGPYVPFPDSQLLANKGQGITWGTWTSQFYSLEKIEMKVRPNHVGFVFP